MIDLVESVRLMAADEAALVGHWHRFMHHVHATVLPHWSGRLVKSLGDGLLAEFDRASDAVKAAFDMHQFFEPINQRLAIDDQLHLRAGVNATYLYVGTNDVYGNGVNLAARVAGLAGLGETVVTASVHDQLVDGVDCEVHDMGESYLKHWPERVRTWQALPINGKPQPKQPPAADGQLSDFRPSIAVIPFASRSTTPEHFVIGDLIADGVIAQLSRSRDLRVISRLSTARLRDRGASPSEIDTLLDAAFVLSGSYFTQGDRLVIMAELTSTRRNEVVWADRLTGDTMDLLQNESQLLHALALACADNLLQAEVQRTLHIALPRLDSNALMLGGITLMHRSTRRDLEQSFVMLEAVLDRHKRVASPWAWLAKWHIMQVVQGLTSDPSKDFRRAIELADRALDLEPNSSLAMAVKGHALCHLGADLAASRQVLQDATQANPNDPIAWLYAGFWSSMWGDPKEAVRESESALQLSPLDPQRYYLQMLAANSYLAMGRLEEVCRLCETSLRVNRYHLPTLRAKLVAEYELGHQEKARETLGVLRQMQPTLTVSQYQSYGMQSPLRQRAVKAFEALGLPA